jgi:hypothetical protein
LAQKCRNNRVVILVCLLADRLGGWPMSDTSHLESKTNAGRALECGWLATICPKNLREGYLELAAEYERLAKLNRKLH